MQHHPTRTAFGQLLGHPTKPNLRFFFPPPGDEGAGGGSGGSSGGSGGEGGAGGAGGTGGEDEKGVDAATAKALRDQADKRMQERNAARDEAKKWTDLGLTLEEVAELKANRDKAKGGPSEDDIRKAAQRDADKAAADRYATKARASAVREQATALGFHNPRAALALLDPTKLAAVEVTDDEADGPGVKKLLEDLAKAEPYLVKKQEEPVADWRAAGIGGTGSSTGSDPGPGTSRMEAAYASSGSGRK